MPDKNVLPASQSPFAQRAQPTAPVQQPQAAQPAQPQQQTPAGDSQASQTLAAFNVSLSDWQGKIKNANSRDELQGIIGELNTIKGQIKAQVNPTANPISSRGGKAPAAAAQPSPFARQQPATPAPVKGMR